MSTQVLPITGLPLYSRSAPENGFLLWWLGQNSFVYKNAQGTRVAIDPYLSDFCATGRQAGAATERSRRFPPAIEPEELDCDWILLTHSHCDHADPLSLQALAKNTKAQVAGGVKSLAVAHEAGFEVSRCYPLCPGEELDLDAQLKVRVSFALPTDGSDLNHMGFLLMGKDGSSFWNSGDTAWSELLPELACAVLKNADGSIIRPNVFAVCINAGYGNLSHWEAAKLAGAAEAQIAVPTHWDLFPHNSLDPFPFKNSLSKHAPSTLYRPLEQGACYQWQGGSLERLS